MEICPHVQPEETCDQQFVLSIGETVKIVMGKYDGGQMRVWFLQVIYINLGRIMKKVWNSCVALPSNTN